MEVMLHAISGKYENENGIEIRDFKEGLAKSHFSVDGLRGPVDRRPSGAPVILIMGDSHVEALQVEDADTMGERLYGRLQRKGIRANVLQYGWADAGGPDFVWMAPFLFRQFGPQHIFVVVNYSDLDNNGRDARLRDRGGAVVAEALNPNAVPGRPTTHLDSILGRKAKESGLIYAAGRRAGTLIRPLLSGNRIIPSLMNLFLHGQPIRGIPVGVTSADFTGEVDLVVSGLKSVYGRMLHILYVPNQPFSAEETPEAREAALLRTCESASIPCRSLRKKMVELLVSSHKLARGFSNTAPGSGHLNAEGHDLVAREICDWVESSEL
jgi:hypothetical protein